MRFPHGVLPTGLVLAGSLVLALSAPPLVAQDDTDPLDGTRPQTGTTQAQDDMQITTLDPGAVVRGSSILGCEIQDSTGEKVGEVRDLVVGPQGDIKAVLVECDGVDDGLVALPMEVLAPRFEVEEAESDPTVVRRDRKLERLVLGSPHKPLLESGPRYRENNLLDDAFLRRVRIHYGLAAKGDPADPGLTAGADGTRPMGGIEPLDDDESMDDGDPLAMPSEQPVRLADKVLDKDVVNTANEDLGEIEDVAVAIDRAEIVYAVMESGGILGLGEKRFAVPWSSLDTEADNRSGLVLDVSRERLAQADGFERWPSYADTTLFGTSMRRTDDSRRHDGTRSSSGTARRER